MKILFATLILSVFTLPALPQNTETKTKPIYTRQKKYGVIIERYDKFKDETIVAWDQVVSMPSNMQIFTSTETSIGIVNLVVNSGKGVNASGKNLFAVKVVTKSRVPLFDAKPIYIIADDGRMVIENTERLRELENASSVLSTAFSDTYSLAVGAELKWDDLKKIAASKSVEMKVDKFEFKLKPEHIENLKAYISYVENYVPPKPKK